MQVEQLLGQLVLLKHLHCDLQCRLAFSRHSSLHWLNNLFSFFWQDGESAQVGKIFEANRAELRSERWLTEVTIPNYMCQGLLGCSQLDCKEEVVLKGVCPYVDLADVQLDKHSRLANQSAQIVKERLLLLTVLFVDD